MDGGTVLILSGAVKNVSVLGIVGRLVKFVDKSDSTIEETLADYVKVAKLDVVEINSYPREPSKLIVSFKEPVTCEVKSNSVQRVLTESGKRFPILQERVVICGYRNLSEGEAEAELAERLRG